MTSQFARNVKRKALSQRALLLVVLVVGAIYTGVIGLNVRHHGGNLSSLINVGQKAGETEPDGLGHHVVIMRNSNGYDGQTYYYIADDLSLQRRTFRDAFRYQRIGYPLATWAVSLGQRDWRPFAIVGINLVAVMLVAYLSSLLIALFGNGASVWWALVGAVNPNLIIGVQADLAEPLVLALSLAGLLLYLRRCVMWAAVALAAALLTREVAILFVAPLLVAEIAARQVRHGLALVMAIVPYLVWQLVLIGVFGHAGTASTQANFGASLDGIRAVVTEARHASLRNALIHEGSILVMVVLVGIAVIVAALDIYRRYDVVLGAILAHGVHGIKGNVVVRTGHRTQTR